MSRQDFFLLIDQILEAPPGTVRSDAPLAGYPQWDSLALLGLIAAVDKHFGMNLPVPGQDNRPALLFTVGSRVVMNWRGAKRLAISLGQVIRQFEEANGEIQLNPAPPKSNAPRLGE